LELYVSGAGKNCEHFLLRVSGVVLVFYIKSDEPVRDPLRLDAPGKHHIFYQ